MCKYLKYVTLFLVIIFFNVPSLSQIPTDSLIAYYPFNGNANDSSGNNLHGITNGGVSWIVNRLGQADSAAYFDGNDGWIKVENAAPLCFDVSTDDYSISLFMRDDSSGHGKLAIMNRWESNNTHSIGVGVFSDSNKFSFTSYINAPGYFDHAVKGWCPDMLNNWHHVRNLSILLRQIYL